MSPFLAPPDFLAILLSLLFLTAITIGLSLNNPIHLIDEKMINFNYVICLNYFIILFFESYMVRFTTPNYAYLKNLLPYKASTIIKIDIILELLGFKIVLLPFVLIWFFVFINPQEIILLNWTNLLGFVFILMGYVNSCLLTTIIKLRKNHYDFNLNKNLIKLFFFALIILSVVNYNSKFIRLDTIEALYGLGISLLILNLVFVKYIYFINMHYDRI